jgi:6-phosphogluconolactonase
MEMSMKPILLASLLLLAAGAGAQNRFVYVNDQSPTNTVAGFVIHADGSLTQLGASPFLTDGSGGGTSEDQEGLVLVPIHNATVLYATNDGDGSISTFRVNPQNGNLQLAGAPFLLPDTAGDYSMAASPDHRFLFATNRANTLLHVLSIAPNGQLAEVPGSPFAANANLNGLAATPQHFLVAGEWNEHAIDVYSVSNTGALTPVPGSPFASNSNNEAVAANCAGNRIFATGYDQATSSAPIDVYSMQNGALTPVPGSPFASGSSGTSLDLTLAPQNNFLFSESSFAGEIDSLAVARNGSLRPVPGSPFSTNGSWVGGLAVTAAGDYLYSVDFGAGTVYGTKVAPNGSLTPVPGAPFSIGYSPGNNSSPMSVISYPAPACSARR